MLQRKQCHEKDSTISATQFSHSCSCCQPLHGRWLADPPPAFFFPRPSFLKFNSHFASLPSVPFSIPPFPKPTNQAFPSPSVAASPYPHFPKKRGDERKKESQKMHFSASFPPTFFSYHHPSHRFAIHNQEGIVAVFFFRWCHSLSLAFNCFVTFTTHSCCCFFRQSSGFSRAPTQFCKRLRKIPCKKKTLLSLGTNVIN